MNTLLLVVCEVHRHADAHTCVTLDRGSFEWGSYVRLRDGRSARRAVMPNLLVRTRPVLSNHQRAPVMLEMQKTWRRPERALACLTTVLQTANNDSQEVANERPPTRCANVVRSYDRAAVRMLWHSIS
jgi:hypothetical protein